MKSGKVQTVTGGRAQRVLWRWIELTKVWKWIYEDSADGKRGGLKRGNHDNQRDIHEYTSSSNFLLHTAA